MVTHIFKRKIFLRYKIGKEGREKRIEGGREEGREGEGKGEYDWNVFT